MQEAELLGPDGKPLLADFDVDEYGNVIPPKPTVAALAKQMAAELLEAEGGGHLLLQTPSAAAPAAAAAAGGAGGGADPDVLVDANNNPLPATATVGGGRGASTSPPRPASERPPLLGASAGPRPKSAFKKKPLPKKLSPKKMAAVEKMKSERKEFRDAYRLAVHIPTKAELVEKAKKAFEKRMLHGEEPIGHQVSLQTARKWAESADITKVQLMRHSNYFHKIASDEKLELEYEKHSKVKLDFKRPKSASVVFNRYAEKLYGPPDAGDLDLPKSVTGIDGNTRDSAGMGFIRKMQKHANNSSPLRDDGKPLKSEGKRLEDGDARDVGVVNKGFGTLPTRIHQMIPYGVRAMKNGPPKALFDAAAKIRPPKGPLVQCFSSDGSGRPASPAELQERGRMKMQREAVAMRNSASPEERGDSSPSPGHGGAADPNRAVSSLPVGHRPQTAKQFRRSYF